MAKSNVAKIENDTNENVATNNDADNTTERNDMSDSDNTGNIGTGSDVDDGATMMHGIAVHEGDSINDRLAAWRGVYGKVVAGYMVPVRPRYDIDAEGRVTVNGAPLDDEGRATLARVLNAYYLERAGSTANSEVTRGSYEKKPDADRRAYLAKYLNGEYAFTSGIGSEVFGYTLLERAADAVVVRLIKEALKTAQGDKRIAALEAKLADPKAREGDVSKLLNGDSTVADKRIGDVAYELAALVNERTEVKKRKAAVKTEDADGEIELI
jgi:hypothetical protein